MRFDCITIFLSFTLLASEKLHRREHQRNLRQQKKEMQLALEYNKKIKSVDASDLITPCRAVSPTELKNNHIELDTSTNNLPLKHRPTMYRYITSYVVSTVSKVQKHRLDTTDQTLLLLFLLVPFISNVWLVSKKKIVSSAIINQPQLYFPAEPPDPKISQSFVSKFPPPFFFFGPFFSGFPLFSEWSLLGKQRRLHSFPYPLLI